MNLSHIININPASTEDIPYMVNFSYKKRRAYEKVHPIFWRYAGRQAEISQAKWFKSYYLMTII